MKLERQRAFYPYLADLVLNYFHQDYDIYGDVADVVARFAMVTPPIEVWATIADIKRFSWERSDDAEQSFYELFEPDIVISLFDMTVLEWLAWVKAMLLSHVAPLHSEDQPPPGLP